MILIDILVKRKKRYTPHLHNAHEEIRKKRMRGRQDGIGGRGDLRSKQRRTGLYWKYREANFKEEERRETEKPRRRESGSLSITSP